MNLVHLEPTPLDFSWSKVDPELIPYFKQHDRKTRSSLFRKPSKEEIEAEFKILYSHIERFYPELHGQGYGYQWYITDVGVFIRIVKDA